MQSHWNHNVNQLHEKEEEIFFHAKNEDKLPLEEPLFPVYFFRVDFLNFQSVRLALEDVGGLRFCGQGVIMEVRPEFTITQNTALTSLTTFSRPSIFLMPELLPFPRQQFSTVISRLTTTIQSLWRKNNKSRQLLLDLVDFNHSFN